jgi:hypothetical protein
VQEQQQQQQLDQQQQHIMGGMGQPSMMGYGIGGGGAPMSNDVGPPKKVITPNYRDPCTKPRLPRN